VRDAHRRLGSVGAVRDELGISRSAVRLRLVLAGELAGRGCGARQRIRGPSLRGRAAA